VREGGRKTGEPGEKPWCCGIELCLDYLVVESRFTIMAKGKALDRLATKAYNSVLT